jgi:hypothetical protein
MNLAATTPRPEPFLGAKQLPDALLALGIGRVKCEWSARRLIKAMRETGAPVACRYTVRATDAAAWIIAHSDWSPRSAQRRAAGLFSITSP